VYIFCFNVTCIAFTIGGDRQSEGEASYRLGQAYEKNKDSQTALLVRNNMAISFSLALPFFGAKLVHRFYIMCSMEFQYMEFLYCFFSVFE